MRYEELYAALHHLPSILARPCLDVLQLYMRRRYCARGVHRLWLGNYCCFECGTLLNKAAWRYWHTTLRDGSTRTVVALNEKMALHQVVHNVGLDMVEASEVVIHPSNVLSCVAGEIAPDPRARRTPTASTSR